MNKSALDETSFFMERRRFNIKDKIRDIYINLFRHFRENQNEKKIAFTEFVGTDHTERMISFLPLLHLENQKKVWLEQEKHFGEIYIWMKETYLKHNPDPLAELRRELREAEEEEEGKEERKKKRPEEKAEKEREKLIKKEGEESI